MNESVHKVNSIYEVSLIQYGRKYRAQCTLSNNLFSFPMVVGIRADSA